MILKMGGKLNGKSQRCTRRDYDTVKYVGACFSSSETLDAFLSVDIAMAIARIWSLERKNMFDNTTFEMAYR